MYFLPSPAFPKSGLFIKKSLLYNRLNLFLDIYVRHFLFCYLCNNNNSKYFAEKKLLSLKGNEATINKCLQYSTIFYLPLFKLFPMVLAKVE
jgi:translation initiation factor 2 beta subunit (eIF-2beta)/eIF-5